MFVKKVGNDYVDSETGEIYVPHYDKYTCVADYIKAGVKWVVNMTAKEYDKEEQLEMMLDSDDYYGEEKLDGTRGKIQIGDIESRVFSRRISEKTGWFVENTDSLPQFRSISCPSQKGTILDGEMRIDGKDFKEVASTLNCNWDKAIDRQNELGYITLHAFDIVYYKGVFIGHMKLYKRKKYLEKAIKEINCPNIVCEPYTLDYIQKPVTPILKAFWKNKDLHEKYPNLVKELMSQAYVTTVSGELSMTYCLLSKRAWYEYILLHGGEGLMLKDKNGKYHYKRGREYTKWKAFSTWDCVILDFAPPTKEYNGKLPEDWQYWEHEDGSIVISPDPEAIALCNLKPVSKFYAKGWVGNIIFGVVIEDEHTLQVLKERKATIYTLPARKSLSGRKTQPTYFLAIGESSGFDEQMREYFTKNRSKLVMRQVIEIKAQQLIDKKKGTLRNPRFLRLRTDKSVDQCTFKAHIREDVEEVED